MAALALGCGDAETVADAPRSDDTTTTTVAPGADAPVLVPDPDLRPYPFTSWTETLVDPDRVTPAVADVDARDERVLETTVHLPDGDDPVPLVVFAPGISGHPDKFTELFAAWAEAGYAVAAPAFPLTHRDAPDPNLGIVDLRDQPGDLSFVRSEMVRLAGEPDHPLSGRIDPERVGVAGLSLGGATSYGVTFNDCCRDEAFVAAMVFAAPLLEVGGAWDLDRDVPLLVVHGDADPVVSLEHARDTFERAAGPAWFVTLLGGGHAQPFEDTDTPHDEVVRDLTTAFWDHTLGEDPDAHARFEAAAQVADLTALTRR